MQRSTKKDDLRGKTGDEAALYRQIPDDKGLQSDARAGGGDIAKMRHDRQKSLKYFIFLHFPSVVAVNPENPPKRTRRGTGEAT